jgi:hypothetical protein
MYAFFIATAWPVAYFLEFRFYMCCYVSFGGFLRSKMKSEPRTASPV